ncbi:restriction endonuclease subunit S [Gordonibacter massiliensis (ex Traore et al. 2017)]|uniref:Restriction endonuclease subunit S n=1 Tax=Gordonibacter massiliensis (ex Traore et al. 2017) TaxID=1841863 RepID=A0A842JKQ7_9ACTN|nr:restriction endonuclease subunit S [Gordonibacter massiliensis (ex Traore et al. 2017)]MBC2889710.1 restriction endonuclease subunit S [Gordonibacter massiliensis (ex Traore et al. 2017)]
MIDTKRLRQKILDLAICGKLVPQDPADESASVLLERIHAEKLQMVADGKLKKKDVVNDSVIYLGEDSLHYEKIGDGEPVCIEEELPFELPEGWEWARLGSVAYIASGSTPPKDSFCDSGIPYYKMYNLRNNRIDFLFQPQFVKEETHNGRLRKSKIFPGDVIMNIVGPPLGKLAIAPETYPEANTNQAAVVIRPHGRIVLSEWIRYYLMEMSEISRISTRGSAGQVNVSLTQSKLIRIPIPPLAEQQRIVAALDNLLAYVDAIEREQAELDGLLARTRSKVLDLAIRGKLVPQDPADEPASVLLERIHAEKLQMVADGKLKKKDVAGDSVIYRGDDNSYYERRGSENAALPEDELYPIPASWSWTRLGHISNYGDSSSVSSNEIADDDWILDLEDIEKDTGTIIRRVTKAERDSASSKRPFVSGQLLYSKLRPYLNKVLIAPDDGYCTSEILPIHLYGSCESEFVMTYLRSPYFLQYANHCSYGVKMPRLGTNDGRKAFIALPPVAEQHRISHIVASILNILSSTR